MIVLNSTTFRDLKALGCGSICLHLWHQKSPKLTNFQTHDRCTSQQTVSKLVGTGGFEPPTPSTSRKCSPPELRACIPVETGSGKLTAKNKRVNNKIHLKEASCCHAERSVLKCYLILCISYRTPLLKQRIQTTKRLGEILNSTAGVSLGKSQTRVTALQEMWSSILPSNMAECTRPIRMTQDRLEIDISVSLTDEAYQALDEQLSKALPKYGVRGVTYRQSPRCDVHKFDVSERVSPAARARTSNIEDPGLRTAMAKLISAFDRDET